MKKAIKYLALMDTILCGVAIADNCRNQDFYKDLPCPLNIREFFISVHIFEGIAAFKLYQKLKWGCNIAPSFL